MMNAPSHDDPLASAVYLTGPTASGKTAVGVALARLLDAEVIAMDSMTLYRGMDIGTAKPTIEERQDIPHHLLDVIDPWESASVADYRDWAIAKARDIQGRGRRVLFVGGTPLYLKAMLRGLFEGPGADDALRDSLEAEADSLGDEALHRRLAEVDPALAARLPVRDRRRVIRGLEVFVLSGRPLSSFHDEHGHPAEGAHVFALDRDRDELCERIYRRVDGMFQEGWLDEVRRLLDLPRPLDRVPTYAVGYREAMEHLQGRMTREAMVESTKIRTRQFAKRQRTWFRNLAECRAWPIGASDTAAGVAQGIARAIVGAN